MRLPALAAAFGIYTTAVAADVTWADLAPLFADRCVQCHEGDWAPNGLDLSSYQSAIAGAWSGPVVTSGDPVSPLLGRLRGDIAPRMPLDGPPFLTADEIALVEAWVMGGLTEGAPVDTEPPRPVPAPGAPVVWSDVRPIFDRYCRECHADGGKRGAAPEGLRLDSREAVLAGGERLALLPRHVEMSEIWRRVTGLAQPRMPFDGPPWLDEVEIRLLRDWIAAGAPDDDGIAAPVPAGARIRLRGILTGPAEIDGAAFKVDGGTRIDDRPSVGAVFEMRGVVGTDGTVRATRLRER